MIKKLLNTTTIVFILLFLLFSQVQAKETKLKETQFTSPEVVLILDQIKELREDMNKRFKQVDKRFEELREDMNKRFEQVDRRFEQVDKRFEQVDKRFEFLQLLMLTILGVILGGTIYNIIRDRRIPRDFDAYLEKIRKTEIMVKEIAEREPELMTHFKNIGLL